MPLKHSILWTPRGATEGEITATHPAGTYPLFFEHDALAGVNRHLDRAEREPRFGFLLGHLYRDPENGIEFAVADTAVAAREVLSEEASGAYLIRAWSEAQAVFSGHTGLLLGWYHSHYRHGLAPSEADLDTSARYFGAPWQLSVIVVPDRARPLGGVFRHRDAEGTRTAHSRPVTFYEILPAPHGGDIDGADSAVTWANYESHAPILPAPATGGARPVARDETPEETAEVPEAAEAARQAVPEVTRTPDAAEEPETAETPPEAEVPETTGAPEKIPPSEKSEPRKRTASRKKAESRRKSEPRRRAESRKKAAPPAAAEAEEAAEPRGEPEQPAMPPAEAGAETPEGTAAAADAGGEPVPATEAEPSPASSGERRRTSPKPRVTLWEESDRREPDRSEPDRPPADRPSRERQRDVAMPADGPARGERSAGTPLVIPGEKAERSLLPPRSRRVAWPVVAVAVIALAAALYFLMPDTPAPPTRSARPDASAAGATAAPEVRRLLEETDALEVAGERYAERANDFDAGRIGCDLLTTGYVAADEAYVRVATAFGDLPSQANPRATAAYERAGEEMAEINSHFDQSGCPRP